jgi:hypothetical protein
LKKRTNCYTSRNKHEHKIKKSGNKNLLKNICNRKKKKIEKRKENRQKEKHARNIGIKNNEK